ncbi:type VII secretion integral membrane protein EccD [Streptomyces sp. NPDC005483]|uniref:type VII secretion integral membrane protein EccD n=1 Tax=Streptomyces sp. NPDC005483 TaxID=3154882 RepID=UPI0033A1FE22
MEDERCHVTIVGQRRRVDLSVPVHAAIAEYTPILLRECGEVTADDTFPPAWSLALPGARPFPPEATLAESGVVDGATLYLRDFAAGEFEEIEVTDLEEEISAANRDALAYDPVARARTAVVAGIAALVAAFVTFDAVGPARPTAGFGALVAGACLVLLAAHATRRGWGLPTGIRLTVALAAVPLFVTAALALPAVRGGVGPALAGAGAGALLGAVAARLAVPHLCSTVVLACATLYLPVAAGLAFFGANLLETAAVVVVLLLGVIAVAPTATGHLVALNGASGRDGDPGTGEGQGEVAGLVTGARRLLVAVVVLCAVLLTPALVLLAAADQVWAVALCAVASCSLLLRAGLLNALGAVLPQLAAGAVGIAACLALVPGSFGAPDWIGPVVLIIVAVAVLARGTVRIFGEPDEADERPVWMSTLGLFLAVAAVPLAVGVFGVFGMMRSMGESF